MVGKVVNKILAKRLPMAREAAKLTQTQLADILKMRQSAVAEIEAGRVKRPKKMREIAKAVGQSEEWLLGESDRQVVPLGAEFPPDPDPDEPATIGSETGAKGVPPDGSAQVDVTGGMGAGGVTIVSNGVPGKRGMTFAAEHIADYWRIPPAMLSSLGGARPGDIAIFPVQGDSMEPILTEGDCVFVDTRHRLPSPDGVYALGDEFGGIIVKRLELASRPGEEDPMVRVISDNPKHKPKEWHLSEMHIIGRVLRKFGVVG